MGRVHPDVGARGNTRGGGLPHERVAVVRGGASLAESDVAVLLTTFLLSILVDLTVAIEVGMGLAAFLFIRRMASVTNVSVITREIQQGLIAGVEGPSFERDTAERR